MRSSIGVNRQNSRRQENAASSKNFYERNIVVFADALQNQERQRLRPRIGHQMRPRWANHVDLAGFEAYLLLWILHEKPELAVQNVKCIGCIGVTVPRHLLRRRELQLHDAKAGALGMQNAAFHLVEMAGVPDRLPSAHIGLPQMTFTGWRSVQCGL